MWQQDYYFVGGSLTYSALVAAVPLLTLFYLIGVKRKPAWISAVSALGAAWVVVLLFVRMPVRQAVAATLDGAAFGLFPISWIVFASILLYRHSILLVTAVGLLALIYAYWFPSFIPQS